jgi:hypothetical protein
MAFNVFATLFVERESRDRPVFTILAESRNFLDHFNLAFTVISVALLVNLDVFPSHMQRAILLFTVGVAYGTQFF